jgi:hypothetical protein
MVREKIIIGRTEYVWLVATGQVKVPARIDTGARTTAIWASDFVEEDNILSWKFFAPESEFWTGETFTSDIYKKRVVMSSTGHQETRYYIPITLQMKKRRVRTYCTLANRVHSTFPILIGRNTLGGKFVVDVSHGSRKLSQLDQANFVKLQNYLSEDEI